MKTLIIIWAMVVLIGAGLYGFVSYAAAPVHADTIVVPGCQGYPGGSCESCTIGQCNGKGQGDCPTAPPFDTTGRCADKCPNQTDTLLGFDPTTGVAICQPQSTPMPQTLPTLPQSNVPATVPGFGGK